MFLPPRRETRKVRGPDLLPCSVYRTKTEAVKSHEGMPQEKRLSNGDVPDEETQLKYYLGVYMQERVTQSTRQDFCRTVSPQSELGSSHPAAATTSRAMKLRNWSGTPTTQALMGTSVSQNKGLHQSQSLPLACRSSLTCCLAPHHRDTRRVNLLPQRVGKRDRLVSPLLWPELCHYGRWGKA